MKAPDSKSLSGKRGLGGEQQQESISLADTDIIKHERNNEGCQIHKTTAWKVLLSKMSGFAMCKFLTGESGTRDEILHAERKESRSVAGLAAVGHFLHNVGRCAVTPVDHHESDELSNVGARPALGYVWFTLAFVHVKAWI